MPSKRRAFSATPVGPLDAIIAANGGLSGAVSRTEALSVPAVARGRNLLCSIATLPLEEIDADNNVIDSPLLRQMDPDVPNVVTLSQLVEDLVFDGIGWLQILGFGWNGFPVDVRRVAPSTVSVSPPAGRTPAPLPSGVDPRVGAVVWIDGRPVSGAEVIRFDSPNPGVLEVGGRTIRRAILLDAAAKMYADDPQVSTYFTPNQQADPTDDEVLGFLADWKAARKKRATGWVPSFAQLNTVGTPSPRDLQLVELVKQAGLELANLFGVDPEDLGISTTSRTYANVVDRRRDRINDVLSPYMRAITDRMSMPDVTPRGHVVRFDLDDYLRSNPTERATVQKMYVDMGVYDAQYVRDDEGIAGPVPAKPQAPATPPAPADPNNPPQETPMAAQQAAQRAVATFADQAAPQFVHLELQRFSVDTESRTIEGVAVPYGAVGNGARFERGALKFGDVSRIKLNLDHDPLQTVGVATDIKDGNGGLAVKFRVARTPEGDRALTLAADGVYDGLSIEIPEDSKQVYAVPDPRRRTGYLIKSAPLIGVALTPSPAFDDARLTRVKFTQGDPMHCELCGHDHAPGAQCVTTIPPAVTPEPTPAPAPVPAQFSDQELAALRGLIAPAPARAVVNPVRPTPVTVTREALPYRFDRAGRFASFAQGDNVFSADLHEMALRGDIYGQTEAGKRVMGLIARRFAADPTVMADVDELNPTIQRPEMYVDLRAYQYPIWNAIDKGAPPNGSQPFGWPLRSSSTISVAAHTEGTEPEGKGIVTSSQSVTPGPLSGKASITREVWDMGGNPAVSQLIWNEMERSWNEGKETAAGTFLGTLTAAADIALTTAAVDTALTNELENKLAALNFGRGYNFDVLFVEQVLMGKLVAAKDTTGRKVYPLINPMNASGTASSRYAQLDIAGYRAVPAWGIAQGDGVNSANSWLIDPSTVWGWASAPQRLEFPGTNATGGYAPVAMVDIAMWGYRAFACTDIGGVRQVTYDPA